MIVTYDQVRVLHCLLGNTVVEALHLIDTDSGKGQWLYYEAKILHVYLVVTRLECGDQAKRHMYRIQDTVEALKEKKEPQLCFLLPRHCTCGVFLSSVVCEQKALVVRTDDSYAVPLLHGVNLSSVLVSTCTGSSFV